MGSEATDMEEHFKGNLRNGFGLGERKLEGFEDLGFWVGRKFEGMMWEERD